MALKKYISPDKTITVYNEDCLKVLSKIEDKSVSLIVTSPPYCIGKEYENLKDQEIKIIMKFGGTFIAVTATHLKSGKLVKTTLNFD